MQVVLTTLLREIFSDCSQGMWVLTVMSARTDIMFMTGTRLQAGAMLQAGTKVLAGTIMIADAATTTATVTDAAADMIRTDWASN